MLQARQPLHVECSDGHAIMADLTKLFHAKIEQVASIQYSLAVSASILHVADKYGIDACILLQKW